MKQHNQAAAHEALTRLAAGELRGWKARRLRKRIALDATLRHEWESTQQLWADLKTLQADTTTPPPPVWPQQTTETPSKPSHARTWKLGGIVMNQRAGFALCAALTLGLGCAGYAAHKWLFDPFTDFKDSHGHVWHVVGHFRGQVKQYDLENHSLGSFGTDNSNQPGSVSAEVTVDKRVYPLHGAGRHKLRDAVGKIVGYAELVPESDKQRAQGREDYLHRTNIDEVLSISHGDIDGDREAIGYFGDNREITFRLTGPGKARFTRTDNQHVIMWAIVGSSSDTKPNPPTRFSWTAGDVTKSVNGYKHPVYLTLPHNIPVRVDVLPPSAP